MVSLGWETWTCAAKGLLELAATKAQCRTEEMSELQLDVST